MEDEYDFSVPGNGGDARVAVAAITRWLDTRAQPPAGDAVLREMSQAIGALRETRRIRDDAAAMAIIDAMASAETMEVIVEALERLDDRLRTRLMGAMAANPPRRPRAARMFLKL
jgi:hypothetical protein